jgi:plastocyanin
MRSSSNETGAGNRRRWPVLVALGALAVLATALSACGSGGASTASGGGSTAAGGGSPSQGADNVKLVIKSDEQKAKKGPDGNWHDAFLPANFSVEAGDVVHVTVYNYDDMPHTFTAAGLGVNATIAAGAEEKASKTTFTFHAPQKAGSYQWFCALPCDPWAMTHDGYMKGRVTVA